MNRNGLYALIGVLVVAIVVLGGYLLYERSQQPKLEIKLGNNGIEVNGNG